MFSVNTRKNASNIFETPLYIDEEDVDDDEEEEGSSERSSNVSFSIQHETVGDGCFASHTPRTPTRECFSALELPNM
jgi:hypothetical protein